MAIFGTLSLVCLAGAVVSAVTYSDNLLGCLTTSLCVGNTVDTYVSRHRRRRICHHRCSRRHAQKNKQLLLI